MKKSEDLTLKPTDLVVARISAAVQALTGVQLGESQRAMVESRLQKRVHELSLTSLRDYGGYFERNRETELQHLVSLLTTHHSFFFREFVHFEYLERVDGGLATALQAVRARGETTLRVWSAACSRGQEVYSLAMFLQHYLSQHRPQDGPRITFEILGSDIDPASLEIARNGVYHRNEIKEVPMHLLHGNWAKGTGEIQDFVKAKPVLQERCRFEVINLLQLKKDFVRQFDFIFCRNVFIYFTREQIKQITENLIHHLTPQGVLFIGVSESLGGLNLPLKPLGPSIYGQAAAVSAPTSTPQPISLGRPALATPAVLRVLCVDDSPSILSLLKRMLKPEQGFQVVGVAHHGKEAAAMLLECRPDVITLDIHMPEQNGLEYLRANMSPSHPPVVVISSVSRDHADLALACLDAGASDYVEKPQLINMEMRGEEIRTKLACAVRNRQQKNRATLPPVDHSFAQMPRIENLEDSFRLMIASLGDRGKLEDFFHNCDALQPATFILMEGCETALPLFMQDYLLAGGGKLVWVEGELPSLLAGRVYLGDFNRFFDALKSKYAHRRTSMVVYGQPTPHAEMQILTWWERVELLVEDTGAGESKLKVAAADVMPSSSFAYSSISYLSRRR